MKDERHQALGEFADTEFEATVKRYILHDTHREFLYGGLSNLLYIIAMICDNLSQTHEDYGDAAGILYPLAEQLDRRYQKREAAGE